MRRPSALMRGALVLGLAAGAACSRSGPERYELSGKITFQGRPAVSGMIIFEPDSTRGASGPATLANIEHGKFATLPDQGVVGGPHRVRILAGNGVDSGPLRPHGVPYVPYEVKTTADFPREDSTWDFDIPSVPGPTRE